MKREESCRPVSAEKDREYMRYIGFDMGDGESAVAIFQQGSGIEPIIQPIGGSKSLLSAVGKVHGEIVVGERAYTDSLAEGLSVRFKSRFTYDPSSYDTVVLFAKGVLRALQEAEAIQSEDVLVVGCPAGWNSACRARYRDLLVRAGFHHPQVISESRAAFLYAKYAKTVALDIDVLQESALVIDIGSSTLDFAYIVDGRETGVGTFGEIQLGGGLLDAEILRRAVERNPQRTKLREVFAESKSWYSYCEIEARKVKEQYYTLEAANPRASVKKQVRVCFDGVQKLNFELNATEAASLVDDPLESLNSVSFSAALEQALCQAKKLTAADPPRVVLLTGGASRMQMFQQLCRDIFDDAVVICCPEPEFSIAKGLAYAGWIDENMREFRKAVTEQITDEKVAQVARDAMPELVPGVVNAMVDLVLDEAAIPLVAQWKRGEIDTLQEMSQRLASRMEQVMQSPMAQEALEPVIEAWVKGLTGKMQAMVDPICDQYQVPRREMKLVFTRTGDASKLSIGAKELLGFQLIGTLAGIVISVLTGLLCGGSGIALIAAGPLGFLAGLALGAIVAALGWGTLSSVLMKAKLPGPLRWMNVEKRLHSEGVRKSIRDGLMREMGGKDSAFAGQVVQGFTESFQKHLRQLAQAAEIPIQ